jgi:hypothetical protein
MTITQITEAVPETVLKDPTGKYCYSLDEEAYHNRYDTEAEAHNQAKIDIDAKEGDEAKGIETAYWVAQCVHPLDTINCQIGDDIMEMIEVRLQDEICADEQCLSVTKDDEIELSRIVLEFIRSRAVVQYYGIATPTIHTYDIGSNAA